MAAKKIPIDIDVTTATAKRNVDQLNKSIVETEEALDEVESAGKMMADAINRATDDAIAEIDATRAAVDALDRALGQDFDGDTRVDLAVGADHFRAREGESSTGAVYLVYRVEAGTHDLLEVSGTLWTGGPSDSLGCSLASGDVDGAGGAELLVGATMSEYATTRSGAAYLTFGL